MKPLFIFSLVRSGSTLLQRMLATHPGVATASEPYLLLPLIYSRRDRGIYAEYGQLLASVGISDFCRTLPNGEADYDDAVRRFVLDLYRRSTDGTATFFLDKTPAYCFIAADIMRLFPEGRFIFLWRNPLGVIASTITSLPYAGRWNLFNKWDSYLYQGLDHLLTTFSAERDRVCAVQYEDLITQPEQESARLFTYLGLAPEEAAPQAFASVKLRSQYVGDQKGVRAYQEVSDEPLTKWKATINNPTRRAWCRRYLRWLGPERLRLMGYEYNTLRAELDSVPLTLRHTGADLGWMMFGAGYRIAEYRLARHKLQNWRAGRHVPIHT
jgi:hypothetical protein